MQVYVPAVGLSQRKWLQAASKVSGTCMCPTLGWWQQADSPQKGEQSCRPACVPAVGL